MNRILELIELSEKIGLPRAEKIVRFWKNWKEIEKRKEEAHSLTWQQVVGCKNGYSFNTNYGFVKCTVNTLKDYFENNELPKKTVNEIEFILNYGQTKLKV